MTRKKLMVANWKMHKTPAQAQGFMREFLPQFGDHARDEIAICPAYVCIPAVVETVQGTAIHVGAQDVFWEKEGAFTGAVSAGMLKACGCSHVIIGHSECRQYFAETDDTVNRKLKAALESGLTPIMCVGEALEERKAGITDDVLRRQCSVGLRGISGEKAARLVIAYEPVWAIGTGHTATPQIAAEAHAVVRAEAAKALGRELASRMRILYGGSVKPDNVGSLMAEPEIDGALVGGASLDPKHFAAIVQY